MSVGGPCVQVLTAVRPRLRRFAGSGVFLLVKAPSAKVDIVAQAAASANASVPAGSVVGGFTTMTPKGVAVATYLNGTTHGDMSPQWLDTFSAQLVENGVSGKVTTSGLWSPGLDAMAKVSAERLYPAGFLGFSVDNPVRTNAMSGWQGDADVTREFAVDVQEWATAAPDHQAWASLVGGAVPISSDAVADFLTSSASIALWMTTVMSVERDGEAARRSTLSAVGEAVSSRTDPEADWPTLVQDQTELMVRHATNLDVGMVKNVGRLPRAWSDATVWGRHQTPTFPLVYQRNLRVWQEYVIDAAAVSLLTDKHLANAHDLSGWTVEEVAPKRFLVQAANLEAWFGPRDPDEARVERARADFGDMILTEDLQRGWY